MVLDAAKVLGLSAAGAGVLLAGFGALTGAGMLAAGTLPPERVRGALLGGAALLGGGLLAALPASSVALAAGPFAAAAVGAGVVTALGFPYFIRFLPPGRAGRASGVFFSARAIASTVALPTAGGLVALTGSYRALLAQGGVALLALWPLARAERRARGAAQEDEAESARPPVARVAAVIPVFHSARCAEVARRARRHVDELVLVDDGAPPAIAERLDALGGEPGIAVVRMGTNAGKGSALAAGCQRLLGRADRPDAIVVLDSDGQHDPDCIPALVEAAAHADVVVGDRRGRAGRMPPHRRVTNALASAALSVVTRRRVRDSQCGMRLFRVEALERVPLEPGRFESETRHLRALLRAGMTVAWVPVPTVYHDEVSSFRPVADTARVAREIVVSTRRRPAEPLPGPGSLVGVLRVWWPRLLLGMLAVLAVGLALPTLQPLDDRVFLAVNGLGHGPGWVYEALDPHSRNYLLLTLLAIVVAAFSRRARWVGGAALVMVLAAFASDAVLEVFQIAFDRPRPEEGLGAEAAVIEGRTWSHLPSFPSGHLMVTAAMVAAAIGVSRRLRWPLLAYLAAIALTRITFGAHWPLAVVVGGLMGWEVGLFSVALVRSAGLLPEPAPEPAAATAPQPVGVTR
jgi:dolichol-phosphate mannosyltransferase